MHKSLLKFQQCQMVYKKLNTKLKKCRRDVWWVKTNTCTKKIKKLHGFSSAKTQLLPSVFAWFPVKTPHYTEWETMFTWQYKYKTSHFRIAQTNCISRVACMHEFIKVSVQWVRHWVSVALMLHECLEQKLALGFQSCELLGFLSEP